MILLQGQKLKTKMDQNHFPKKTSYIRYPYVVYMLFMPGWNKIYVLFCSDSYNLHQLWYKFRQLRFITCNDYRYFLGNLPAQVWGIWRSWKKFPLTGFESTTSGSRILSSTLDNTRFPIHNITGDRKFKVKLWVYT